MTLATFRTLGRSGLIVSPLALGTMTFGAQRWGSGEATSRAVFDAYVEAGGNFIDTADVYSAGRSEEMVGDFIRDHQARHRLVLATKAGFARETGYPHAGGNGAKAINTALEGSLRRLRTDHVDLFWLHVWDMVTPAEEVLQTLTTLVRAGKIRHYGISNAPAWYVAKLATLAAAHALPAPIALQFEYSLVERGIEAEHVDAAREFGLGILGWSPLGGGLLTGKYRRAEVEARPPTEAGLPSAAARPGEEAGDGAGRLGGANPFGDSKFTPHNWAVLDTLTAVAHELDRTPASVALAWSLARQGIAGLILGASRVEQLHDNLAALAITLSPGQRQRLDAVSATPRHYPANLATPAVNRMVFGGQTVTGWRT